MKNFKKVLAIVLAFVMVLGLGSMTFAAGESTDDIVLDDAGSPLIGTFNSGIDGWQYLGYVYLKEATSDYKYLQMTYTGSLTGLRLETTDSAGAGTGNAIWFNKDQANHFVTADGSDIQLTVTEPTTIVIDLAASGISDISTMPGLHFHSEAMATNGGVEITDARLMKAVPTVESDDIILDDAGSPLMGTFNSGIDGWQYLGYVYLKEATSDYKYLQMTYTGSLTGLRLETTDSAGAGTGNTIWFNKDQANHFVTADGSDIQLTVTEPTTIVIDLAASGISDISTMPGLHFHSEAMATNGGVEITDARLKKTADVVVPEETTEASTEETTAEETTEETTEAVVADYIVLNGDDAGASSMMGDYSAITGTGYKYVGFATSKDATDDYKYLQITYTGDVRFLRIEADGEGGANAKWFDSAQALHLVTADGSAIPLEVTEPTTIVIDLEASGYPATGSYIGYQMHYLDGAVESNGFVITDARLTKTADVVVPEETTEASTEETTAEETTAEETTVEETTIEVEGNVISMIILDGDDEGDSSMMGDYSTITGTGYKYVGFATSKDATDDYKYLVIEYVGDVRFLRLEADGEGGANAKWFDQTQEKHINIVAIVDADGNELDELPLETDEPISIMIDLEASGFPATGSYIGYHMHYLDPEVEANGFAITAAALITDIPEEGDEVETVAPTTEATAEATTQAPGTTTPSTGDVTPVAVVMIVCLLSVVVLGGTLVVRRRNF